jgi:hypothetical protein
MHEVFELAPVATRDVAESPYLIDYQATQAPGPYRLGLYRIGARKLSPERGARLLPEPIADWIRDALPFPYGTATAPQMEPPDPPL